MTDFKYNSKYTAPIKQEYMQWLKKNHPGEYYDNFGGKKPFNRLSKVGKVAKLGKYGALAGIVYELGKEVLDMTGNIPNDLEEREMLRQDKILNNIPKIVIDENGKQTLQQPDPEDLKDHLPYKKYLSNTPSAPGSGDEVEGVDFVWVDPYEQNFGPVTTEGYELGKFGWTKKVEKNFLQNQVETYARDIKAVSSVIPPEIKTVTKKAFNLITGNPERVE